MLGMFQVPQLSYASSSAMLDDKTKYSFFSRTVPSDTLQAEAIVDILQRFNWTYVSLLYAEGSYGSEGLQGHQETDGSPSGTALAVVLELGDDFTPEQFDNVVEKLMEKKQAKVNATDYKPESTASLSINAVRVKFKGESANISFDAQGNGMSNYEIRCLALENDDLVLRQIGKWEPTIHDFDYFNEVNAALQ
nr:hypothetical protein BaRGS_006701 [Batillaria attramentaria]